MIYDGVYMVSSRFAQKSLYTYVILTNFTSFIFQIQNLRAFSCASTHLVKLQRKWGKLMVSISAQLVLREPLSRELTTPFVFAKLN